MFVVDGRYKRVTGIHPSLSERLFHDPERYVNLRLTLKFRQSSFPILIRHIFKLINIATFMEVSDTAVIHQLYWVWCHD